VLLTKFRFADNENSPRALGRSGLMEKDDMSNLGFHEDDSKEQQEPSPPLQSASTNERSV
jgi:hypothetical protein